jgi:eukaryotic-like serine/threonine-protein kinase
VTLASGTKLGPYEILSPLGAGGMGEVYKARDTRLERTVAVKVLPQRLSSSPEVRQRFEREAKTISQLSHPHICALYDVGREGETEYLVMEYLEGETLSERLAKGALPLEATLRYGTEIADSLDKAHRQGIVHRDLKPGNVMLTKSGVKLLDFGLAKALPPSSKGEGLTSLPTQQKGLTQEGTILGTFQYMAPEQLEGKEADARTDIFALGASLYEMATGNKAFSGTSQASLIGAILHTDPPAVSTVRPMTPPALDRIVKTCMAKDPEDRWQSAADVKRELQWLGEGSAAGAAVPAASSPRGRWVPWAIAALAVVAAAVVSFRSRQPTPTLPERMQLSIVPPERMVLSDSFDISPDGRTLAFVGTAGGKTLLRTRMLGSDEVRALSGTEAAESPIWSPDSRSLAFFSRGKLRRIELATGSIDELCDGDLGRGGSWGSKGDILFTQKAVGAIYRVPASGGQAVATTTLEKGDVLHRWPRFLPDGRRFLFFVKSARSETTGIYLASLDSTRERKLLLRNGAAGEFVSPDLLLFVKGETLLAQHIDAGRAVLLGEPEAVARPVLRADVAAYRDLFTVSRGGIIAFRPGSAERRLTWLDRRGNVVKTVGPPGVIMNVSLSPDDRIAGFTSRSIETGLQSIWIVDLERDVATPFTDLGWMPTFSPDGRAIFYRYEGETYGIRRKQIAGGPAEKAVVTTGGFPTPYSVSHDGRFILYTITGAGPDIAVKDLESGKEQLLLATEFEERWPHFSPDGRFFVYSSNEPGQWEVFVRRFPMTEEKWRISTSGGQQPMWSPTGKEILFIDLEGRLMAAPVSEGAALSAGTPQPLFRTSIRLNPLASQYAVSADGQRFLAVIPTREYESENFRVLLNWQPSVARR